MIKFLVGVLVIGIVAFAGFIHFTPGPLTAKESIDKAIVDAKETSKLDLNPEQEALLKVQLAISDYMARNGQPPDSLRQLVPTYFESEPLNPVTGAPFEYQRVGKSPKLGGQIAMAAKKAGGKENAKDSADLVALLGTGDGFVNPNTIKPENYTYDPTGKRDPFAPYSPKVEPTSDTSPLTSYSIGQLRVAAILSSESGEKKAIVEDDQGRGYSVSKDTVIGKEHGVVVEIEEKALKVVIAKKDFGGNDKEEVVTMELNHAGTGSQQKRGNGAQAKKKR